MLKFNTIYQDPQVSIIIDEVKIVDFLTDHGGIDVLKKADKGLRAPSRPSSLIYVDFFFDFEKKMLFLLLADNKELGLKFPGKNTGKNKPDRMVLISSTSSKALLKYFSECARVDTHQQGICYNVQHFLTKAFRKNEILVE